MSIVHTIIFILKGIFFSCFDLNAVLIDFERVVCLLIFIEVKTSRSLLDKDVHFGLCIIANFVIKKAYCSYFIAGSQH